MAQDRMQNDDLDRNMGGRQGQGDDLGGGQDFGQQTPGRNPNQQQGQQTGQKGAGQHNQMDDEESFGGGGSKGQGGQGGQKNPGQQQNR